MTTSRILLNTFVGACAVLTALLFQLSNVQAYTYSVLYSFCAQAKCADGAGPVGHLVADQQRNLYGVTFQGGAANTGTIFKIAPDGTETVLYSFCAKANCADGSRPNAGLLMDSQGNLYGTTTTGGTGCFSADTCGVGTVFKLSPDGTETVLHSFCSRSGCSDGFGAPMFPLIMDEKGNLIGATTNGGLAGCDSLGCGVVFKIAPDGRDKVLYAFCALDGCADGDEPSGPLILDTAGNLYGETHSGGPGAGGTVFKLSRTGAETVLAAFISSEEYFFGWPTGGLTVDPSGNLFGFVDGQAFELPPEDSWSVIQYFCYQKRTCPGGAGPNGGLVRDNSGVLYGATFAGGKYYPHACRHTGCGVAFALASTDGKHYSETVLYTFCQQTNCADGAFPQSDLTMDQSGNLYGTNSKV